MSCGHQRAQLVDVLGHAHEAQRDGSRGPARRRTARSARSFSVSDGAETCTPGRFMPLLLLERAAVQHRRSAHAAPSTTSTTQLEQAVVDEDAIARPATSSREVVVGDRDLVAGSAIVLGHEHDRPRRRRVRRGLGSTPMRMRGPCRSPRIATGAPQLGGHAAHGGDGARVRLVRAVREVDARHVEAGLDELADHLRRAAGRPERADDLGAREDRALLGHRPRGRVGDAVRGFLGAGARDADHVIKHARSRRRPAWRACVRGRRAACRTTSANDASPSASSVSVTASSEMPAAVEVGDLPVGAPRGRGPRCGRCSP